MQIFLRKIGLLVALAAFTAVVKAQNYLLQTLPEPSCSGSSYRAYPGPERSALTPSPEGMQPFYISHFGRYGSRYHTKPSTYNAPYLVLAVADSLGRLTPWGREVMMRLDRIRHDAENRWGDLTPLGAEQQRQIARRMMERFPEVFGSQTVVSARSITVGRSILSMEYLLLELLTQHPHLKVHHNATHRDAVYLNLQDKVLAAKRMPPAVKGVYNRFSEPYIDNRRLMLSLFNDSAYVSPHVDADQLNRELFNVAISIQNTGLRHDVTLFDCFTADELYRNWKRNNAWWYVNYGACALNGALQPYSQRNLLRRLIADADSCIMLDKPSVQLRFGDETAFLPLICLMDVNRYGLSTSRLDSLEQHGWADYRIVPMAANVQFVFYRRHDHDRDVLFKVLLNEDEATLPLPAAQPPYYRWRDFRDYFLRLLDAYGENHL